MKFLALIKVTFLIFLGSNYIYAQSCSSTIKSLGGANRFIDNGNGTITDVLTLNVWDSCSVGQTFTNGQCNGAPLNFDSWRDALVYSESVNGKRLPNIKELGSIVDRSCVEPSIDIQIFPDTPLAVYWTNTPSNLSTMGRIVDFTDGVEFLRDVNKQKYIRLIKE